MSKTFAMTGWRIGYTLAPEALVQATVKLQSQSTSNPTSIAQHAALEAMRGSMDSVPVMLAEYTRRRRRIVDGLRAIPGVTCEEPGGAFYAFPNVAAHLANGTAGSALAKNTTELAKLLLDKARVALVPGDAFGAPGLHAMLLHGAKVRPAREQSDVEAGLRQARANVGPDGSRTCNQEFHYF